MCLYPRLIYNKKYLPNKKNNWKPPTVQDQRTTLVPVGCGNCIECRKQKAREWQTRITEDIKTNTNGKMVTLTFSNESIKKIAQEIKGLEGYGLDNEIATKGMRYFLERWRKKYKKSVRHWMVTELGHKGTENVHIHGIIWTSEKFETIAKIWQYGWIYPRNDDERKNNYVSARTVNYIIKYITKQDLQHYGYKSKILTSAGIGANYKNTYNSTKNKYQGTDTDTTYRTATGHKIALPTYWRNKIYTENEREQLWLQMLDKEQRWVGGIKIDISNNTKEYDKAVEHHRKNNLQLGYGTDKRDDERYWYAQQQRKLRQWQREHNIREYSEERKYIAQKLGIDPKNVYILKKRTKKNASPAGSLT